MPNCGRPSAKSCSAYGYTLSSPLITWQAWPPQEWLSESYELRTTAGCLTTCSTDQTHLSNLLTGNLMAGLFVNLHVCIHNAISSNKTKTAVISCATSSWLLHKSQLSPFNLTSTSLLVKRRRRWNRDDCFSPHLGIIPRLYLFDHLPRLLWEITSDWRVPDTRPNPIILGYTQSVSDIFSQNNWVYWVSGITKN